MGVVEMWLNIFGVGLPLSWVQFFGGDDGIRTHDLCSAIVRQLAF